MKNHSLSKLVQWKTKRQLIFGSPEFSLPENETAFLWYKLEQSYIQTKVPVHLFKLNLSKYAVVLNLITKTSNFQKKKKKKAWRKRV